MKTRYALFMVTLFLFTMAPAHSNSKGKWKLLYQKDGIVVHKRTKPGSSHVEFRGRGALEANIVRCLAVLSDYERSTEWIDRLVEMRKLKEISDTQWEYYSAVKAPWPLSERDFVARARFIIDETNGWIHIKSKNIKSSVGKDKGRVRMPFTRVRWSFKPLSEEKVWLEFQVHADPGGAIPAWVANLVAKELPYKSLVNFRKRVKSNLVRKEFIAKFARFSNWGLPPLNPSTRSSKK